MPLLFKGLCLYTHLQEGLSKVDALRAAQVETIINGEYTYPYY